MKTPCLALAAALLLPAACETQAGSEASYPSRPIHFIVPSSPGNPPDVIARLLGEQLSRRLGVPVVVENRPGAIGTIGLGAVARSAPDGYTIGVSTLPFIIAPRLLSHVSYDTEKDLAPVALVAWNYTALAVPASARWHSVAELVAAARAHPGTMKFASAGNGTPSHLGGELLNREAGIELVHIPYKGGPAAVAALLAGDADLYIGAAGAIAAQVRSGRLRALATPAPQRLAALPDVPTLAELGYPGVQITDWQGVVAPAKTPTPIIARLRSEIGATLRMPEVRARLEKLGMPVADEGPKAFGAHVHGELQRWRKLVQDAGIHAD